MAILKNTLPDILVTENIINDIIKPIVLKIRKELAADYNITGDKYLGYRGLCNTASEMFKHEIEMANTKYGISIAAVPFHGEQRHTVKIKPADWYIEHTWLAVCGFGLTDIIYVDITSQQFQYLYDDIPDYYISTDPPKWYLLDGDNYFWRIFPRRPNIANVIYKFEYYIWGSLCKIYRKLFKLNKERR